MKYDIEDYESFQNDYSEQTFGYKKKVKQRKEDKKIKPREKQNNRNDSDQFFKRLESGEFGYIDNSENFNTARSQKTAPSVPARESYKGKENLATPAAPAAPTTQVKKEFVFGPNSHLVNGKVMIDFDRVKKIEKVDKELPNGYMSYGINFIFSMKTGASKIVWYGRNLEQRDKDFEEENQNLKALQKGVHRTFA